jgi:hypothetical protein
MRSGVLGLVLVTLVTAPAWAQGDGSQGERWFRVSWEPSSYRMLLTIRGQVQNVSPYRVTNVRLQVDGLGPDSRPVGRIFVWAVGDIAPGGQTSFAAEPIPGSATYQVKVVSWDLVSVAREAP